MSDELEYLVAPERYATDRFVLRSWLPGDGPALADVVAASYDHLSPWLAWPTSTADHEASERTVRQFRGRWLLAEEFTLAVLSPDEQRVLGGSGFHLRDGPLSDRQAEIGMWIAADVAGQGLGTEVLRAVLRWGFDAWPWERLGWRCDVDNHASARTAEAAGMTLEGTLRHTVGDTRPRVDHHVYAALRHEWIDDAGRVAGADRVAPGGAP